MTLCFIKPSRELKWFYTLGILYHALGRSRTSLRIYDTACVLSELPYCPNSPTVTLPESEEQFIKHVTANPQVWYYYCQAAYLYMEKHGNT
jgi:hypothetical protein